MHHNLRLLKMKMSLLALQCRKACMNATAESDNTPTSASAHTCNYVGTVGCPSYSQEKVTITAVFSGSVAIPFSDITSPQKPITF